MDAVAGVAVTLGPGGLCVGDRSAGHRGVGDAAGEGGLLRRPRGLRGSFGRRVSAGAGRGAARGDIAAGCAPWSGGGGDCRFLARRGVARSGDEVGRGGSRAVRGGFGRGSVRRCHCDLLQVRRGGLAGCGDGDGFHRGGRPGLRRRGGVRGSRGCKIAHRRRVEWADGQPGRLRLLERSGGGCDRECGQDRRRAAGRRVEHLVGHWRRFLRDGDRLRLLGTGGRRAVCRGGVAEGGSGQGGGADAVARALAVELGGGAEAGADTGGRVQISAGDAEPPCAVGPPGGVSENCDIVDILAREDGGIVLQQRLAVAAHLDQPLAPAGAAEADCAGCYRGAHHMDVPPVPLHAEAKHLDVHRRPPSLSGV